MGRTLKSCTVSWTPTGDPKRILGWNVVLNDSATNPYGGNIYKQVFVPKPSGTDYSWIGQQQTYTIKNVVVDGGAAIYAWVQQVYRDGDSEWLSSTGQTAADDGLLTANELLGPEQTAGKGIKIINGGIQSVDFSQPTGSAQGVGFRIQDGKVEAYGNSHVFGGPTFFNTGDYLITLGLALNDTALSKRYPTLTDFTSDGRSRLYGWDTVSLQWTELAAFGPSTQFGDTVFGARGDLVNRKGGVFHGRPYGVYGRGYDYAFSAGTGVYGYGESYGGRFVGDPNITDSVGVYCSGTAAPIRLAPASTNNAPTHAAPVGSLWVTANGNLYIRGKDALGVEHWYLVGGPG